MIKQPKTSFCHLAVVIMCAVITACGAGPSEAEFVEACLQEGQNVASKMLDREMGITRDTFCKCGAKVAKASLSADGYRVMILGMQNKKQEASAISSKMSDAEQQAVLKGTAELFEKCVESKK